MIQWAGKAFWPHQERGLQDLFAALASGQRRVVFTSPTGGGKSLCMGYAIDRLFREGKTVDLMTNRRLLLNQLCDVMRGFGIPFGVRAAEMEHLADATQPVQFVMVQTELSRKKNRVCYQQRKPDVVFVDEAHNQWGGGSGDLLREYLVNGAVVVSVTATPVGCPSDIGDTLIVAGKTSELRACGALLLCRTHEPDVPNGVVILKPTKTGEFLDRGVVKAIMSPTVHARVQEWLLKINPDLEPTILFGPNVPGSLYFAEKLTAAGIRSAHIDGDNIWIDGETHPATPDLRQEMLRESRNGSVKVLCNRFLLREGIDATWLKHAVLATAFGSITSYVQSVGRLLRAHPGMKEVTLQDHGGNYRRHGSPNADRIWLLGKTANDYAEERQQQLREKKESEGIICPKCGSIRLRGPECVTCGHRSEVHGRYVVEESGRLRFVKGDVYEPIKVVQRDDTEVKWAGLYWSAKNSKKSNLTFGQLYGIFIKDNHYYPPKNLPWMPKNQVDWHCRVKDLPVSELNRRERVMA